MFLWDIGIHASFVSSKETNEHWFVLLYDFKVSNVDSYILYWYGWPCLTCVLLTCDGVARFDCIYYTGCRSRDSISRYDPLEEEKLESWDDGEGDEFDAMQSEICHQHTYIYIFNIPEGGIKKIVASIVEHFTISPILCSHFCPLTGKFNRETLYCTELDVAHA